VVGDLLVKTKSAVLSSASSEPKDWRVRWDAAENSDESEREI
jgi:hypothetical protein